MMTALMITCVVLLLCPGALRSEGDQLSDLGVPQVKSCEKEEQVKGADVNEPEGNKLFENSHDRGKTKLWMSRYLMSDLREDNERETKKSSYILDENLRQKWQKLVRQQKRAETLTEAVKGTRIYLEPTSNYNISSRLLQQQNRQSNVQKREDDLRNGNQGLVANTEHAEDSWFGNWSRRHSIVSKEPYKKNAEVSRDHSPSRQGHPRNLDSKQIIVPGAKPSLRSLDHSNADKTSDLHSRLREPQISFVTQSTMIYPFIATTQALNYLTSYDSMPLPKRWPIRMILPERGQSISPELKVASNNNEHKIVFHRQDGPPSSGGNQHSIPLLQPVSKRKDKRNIKSLGILSRPDVDDGQVGETTHGTLDCALIENAEVAYPDNPQQIQTSSTVNKLTQDAKLVLNSDESIENQAEKSRKERKRKRQQLRKRKKKLKRQRKRRKQKTVEIEIIGTSIMSVKHEPTFPPGSTQADPGVTSKVKSKFRKSKMHSLVTEVEYGKTTIRAFLNSTEQHVDDISPSSHREGSSSDKTGASGPTSDYSLMYGDRIYQTNNDGSDSPAIVDITQPTNQLFKTSTHKTIYKTHTDHNNDEVSKFSDFYRKRKNNDNQKFTSLQSSTQTFVIPFRKDKLLNCKEQDDSLTNCSENITNDSPDNTDKNVPQHLQDHTNSDPDRKPTSLEDKRSVPQVNKRNRGRKTTNSSRSAEEISPTFLTQAPPPQKSEKTKTTKVKDNVKNSPKTSRMYTNTTPLLVSPRDVPLSELSSARLWKERIKQNRARSNKVSKDHQSTTKINSDKSEYNMKGDRRRGSLAFAFSTPTYSQNPDHATSDSKNGYQGRRENGPFIDYKSAFDFLSSQKGARTNSQNEARREANELNRYMAEGMCEIFNKHYVPTSIGGKCE